MLRLSTKPNYLAATPLLGTGDLIRPAALGVTEVLEGNAGRTCGGSRGTELANDPDMRSEMAVTHHWSTFNEGALG